MILGYELVLIGFDNYITEYIVHFVHGIDTTFESPYFERVKRKKGKRERESGKKATCKFLSY